MSSFPFMIMDGVAMNAEQYRRMDAAKAQDLIARGYTLAVYVVQGYGEYAEGDVLSVHKTREAAQRKANYSSDHWAVRPLQDYL
jgi:hypothetical protein